MGVGSSAAVSESIGIPLAPGFDLITNAANEWNVRSIVLHCRIGLAGQKNFFSRWDTLRSVIAKSHERSGIRPERRTCRSVLSRKTVDGSSVHRVRWLWISSILFGGVFIRFALVRLRRRLLGGVCDDHRVRCSVFEVCCLRRDSRDPCFATVSTNHCSDYARRMLNALIPFHAFGFGPVGESPLPCHDLFLQTTRRF